MSEDKKLEFQANRWANNKERSLRNKWYAIGRIDLLIISISGAGIYSCFEIIKFMYSNKIESEFLMLKIAGALFVFSILLNFISQFASEYSNDKNAIYNNKKFNDLTSDDKQTEEKTYNTLECKMDLSDNVVKYSNRISSFTMLVGVALVTTFLFTIVN